MMQKSNDLGSCQTLRFQNLNSSPSASSQKSKGSQNFQKFQTLTTSLKHQASKESIDTECTSNPPDHSDKNSLKSIDEAIEFQEVQPRIGQHHQIDFHQLSISQSVLEKGKKGWQTAEATFITHFRQTMKIDKYLRLVCSIIKTRRAYAPKSSLNPVYKELILARRVIRWESKYDTIIDLCKKEEPTAMKLFKVMQLIGDFVDLVAFWIKTIHKGTDNSAALIDQLEQTESNFYFAECSLWFVIYTYRYFMLRRKENKNEEEAKETKKKLVQNLLKAIKYFMDILTSYNNSSLKKVGGEINHKLAGYLTFLSSAMGIFLLWR